jgi:ketosteroid isomerase-like protein
MKSLMLILHLLFVPAAFAQTLSERGTPLDHLVGRWVMTGTIAGQEITHDLEAEWVLGGHYLFFHELARDRDEAGKPAYESRVYFGWDEPNERLVCLWLDVTGGGGLIPEGFGYGRPDGNRIPFVWGEGADSGIHNTFTYRPEDDSWSWRIDNVRGEELSNFAQVVLNRETAAMVAGESENAASQGILDAIAELSEATAPGGGGADAYAALLADDFSRRSLTSEQVQGRQAFIDGIRQWLDEGWRVVSRESQMIDSTVVGDTAYTHRIVTETFTGPNGEQSGPSTFALEETWERIAGRWLLHRATVYPVQK